jgi:monothiol glutaredoxin
MMQLLRVACVLSVAQAFVAPHARQPRHAMRGAPEDAADAKIDSFVKDNKVMLFMKGTKIFPQCGFSNMAVQILNAIGADFETCDVLSDDFIRQQIKVYSDWPTIPQLYVDGEFVGGSDIMLEMYQAGELQEMIEVAAAS